MKLFISIFILFGSLFAQSKDTLVIGTTSGYAPFVSLNEKGQYEGFDIDIAEVVAKKLNKILIIKDLGSMPSLILGLKQKKVDALIWAISITNERQAQMNMIYYQGEKVTQMPLLFWKDIPQGVQRIEDLVKDSKKGICVEAGSYQEQVLNTYSGLKLKNVDKITDALLEIRFGKSTAIAVDPDLVANLKAQNPELQTLYIPLPLEMQSQGSGICINKNNPELTAAIAQAIADLRQEGKLLELEKKWKLRE